MTVIATASAKIAESKPHLQPIVKVAAVKQAVCEDGIPPDFIKSSIISEKLIFPFFRVTAMIIFAPCATTHPRAKAKSM
jgi:hypothetical protein